MLLRTQSSPSDRSGTTSLGGAAPCPLAGPVAMSALRSGCRAHGVRRCLKSSGQGGATAHAVPKTMARTWSAQAVCRPKRPSRRQTIALNGAGGELVHHIVGFTGGGDAAGEQIGIQLFARMFHGKGMALQAIGFPHQLAQHGLVVVYPRGRPWCGCCWLRHRCPWSALHAPGGPRR